MKNIAFYAGSFDPFTNGHLQVVRIASKLFDHVTIGIGINPDKTRRFDKVKMRDAIEESLKEANLNNTNVIIYDNETWEAAKSNGSSILIRGLRNAIDYIYEEKIANYNDSHNIETVYLRAKNYGDISSSYVYQKLKEGNDITDYVPESVKKLILK